MNRKLMGPATLSVLGKILGVAASIYVAYRLGPESIAFYAIWLLTLEYLAYFNLGMGPAIFRNISLSDNASNRQETIDLSATILLLSASTAFLLLSYSHFSQLLPIQMTNLEFSLLLVARIIDIWFGITKSIAKGYGIILPQAWIEGILAVVIPLLNAVAVTFLGIIGLMLVHISSSLIGLIIFWFHKHWLSFSLRFDYGLSKKLLKTSLPLFSASVLEAMVISLPIMLSGYVVEGVALGGFLFIFQNTVPEKIPLFSYFSVIVYRSLLVQASKNPTFDETEIWERVDLNLKSYFILTAIGTVLIFVTLNFVSRYLLEEYVSSIPLILTTLPFISLFALRRIFNAYFTAVNRLTKRLAIYVICLLISLCFFGYAKPLGIIDIKVLALWISSLMFFSSTLGLVAFLKDVGQKPRYILIQILYISSSLLVNYFCMKVLLDYSEKFFLDTLEGSVLFATMSLLCFAFYVLLLLCITALFSNKRPDLYLRRLASSDIFRNVK